MNVGRMSTGNQRCESSDCTKPVAWKHTQDRSVGQLLQWKARAEYREIIIDLGLSDNGILGDLGEQNGSRGEETIAYMSLLLKNEQEDRDLSQKRSSGSHPPPYAKLSRYCVEHTCKFFFGTTECTNKKPGFETVCHEHMVCTVQNCYSCKEQYVDPEYNERENRFPRREYCSKHSCSDSDCKMLCDEVAPALFGRYCIKHRCYYKGCQDPSISIKTGKTGYCVKHGCKFLNCTKISVNGSKLCKKHVECYDKNCTRLRIELPMNNGATDKDRIDGTVEIYDRRAYLLFCTTHGLCSENGCKGLRLKGALHCRKHVCVERGCVDGCKDRAKFCNGHRCKTPDCQSPKAWKEDLLFREEFCLAHLCRNGDCTSGVEDMHLYCKEHECSQPSCVAQISGNGLCHEQSDQVSLPISDAILQNTKTTREATKSESQDWIRTLQPRDYNPAAGQQYAPPMRDGGRHYEMIPPAQPARAFPPNRQRYDNRPYDRPPSPQTPIDSPASDIDDDEDEDEVPPGHNTGPFGPARGNISVGARTNSGIGSGVLPANGVSPQKRDSPVDKPSQLNVQNMQAGPGRVGGGIIQRPQGYS